MSTEAYEGWAIVELMGHRRLGGRIKQVEQYGVAMLRVDVPTGNPFGDGEEETFTTQYYGGPSIYCLTPTTEELARRLASFTQPEPIHRFELPPAEGDPDPDDDNFDDDRETPPTTTNIY